MISLCSRYDGNMGCIAFGENSSVHDLREKVDSVRSVS